MHPAWRALLQNIELMPQDQDFSFEPPARLKAVAQHANEKKGNCDHRPGSCSDSVTAATQADGVFGSDNAIHGFIADTDSNPKPFIWRKDPDKIIAAVKRGHQVLVSIH